jgi:hypothetical protein
MGHGRYPLAALHTLRVEAQDGCARALADAVRTLEDARHALEHSQFARDAHDTRTAEVTRDEQARALGVTREEIDQRHATSFARWGYRAFVPADEDWPIDAMWNGPLVRHMRAQMLRGGPSDRCRGNCRVMLGVEEPFFDALTHPDAELTPAVVANRRLLLEEINAGRDALTAKPLECPDLCVRA